MADLNVRNVPDDVLARLRDQARLAGMSLSEWVRIALADRALLPTVEELASNRSSAPGPPDVRTREEFDRWYAARLHRGRG